MIALQVLSFLVGLVIVQGVLRSAVHTVAVPRGEQTFLTRKTFLAMRELYDLLSARGRSHEDRERTMARYAPMSLLVLALIWAMGVTLGFVLLYFGVGAHSFKDCFYLSASSITTLGSVGPTGPWEVALAYSEALIGLGLVALLISYLPTIYQLFSRREAEVVKLDVRAGSPPTALEMLTRFQRIDWLDHLEENWAAWEVWFAELEESHTSHPALVFFRSQRPYSSWITGAGAVLDTAAIAVAALDLPPGPQASVTIRSGSLALRTIAGFYGVPLDPDPRPNAPISIYRGEFELLLDRLTEARAAGQGGPRAGLAGLRRLAGQLRPGPAGAVRPVRGAADPVVVGSHPDGPAPHPPAPTLDHRGPGQPAVVVRCPRPRDLRSCGCGRAWRPRRRSRCPCRRRR